MSISVGTKPRAQFTEVERKVRMVRIDVEVTNIERIGASGGERAHLLIEEKAHLESFVDVEPSTEAP